MRLITLTLLALLLAAFSSAPTAADEKEDKLKEEATQKALEFNRAITDLKVDDAVKVIGTPFTFGTFTKYKTYQKAEDAKALLKDPSGISKWDDAILTPARSLKDVAALKGFTGLKAPVTAILGKNQGYVCTYDSGKGSAVYVIAIKDGKPQVVGLLISR